MYYTVRVKIPITVDVLVHHEIMEADEVAELAKNEVARGIDVNTPCAPCQQIDFQIEDNEATIQVLAKWESIFEED